ncbi:MAG TPA: replication factor C small subunit [Candidatus Woesearchaeota archaeon]|nr:replication factor C small subunit [Candidatus Woesearchaeota archaeon]
MTDFKIWTEKYRPKKLSDVIGQKEIVEKLKAFVSQKNMPHLLFAGPAGTGKTTCALAVAREFYGDNWRDSILELNASDERGIDTIRTKVKDFARTKPLSGAPFKIVILDEADALTKDAQHALRRTMENYTNTCRFILDCNFSSKILIPIQSRCAIFKFKPLTKEDVAEYILTVSKAEGLNIDDPVVEAVYQASEGDLRRVTNILQSSASLSDTITEKSIYSIAGVAKPKEIEEIICMAMKGDMLKSKDKLLSLMLEYGLSGLDTIKMISKQVWNMELPNDKKARLIDKLGEYEFRIVEGSDEYLQIEALLAQFTVVGD